MEGTWGMSSGWDILRELEKSGLLVLTDRAYQGSVVATFVIRFGGELSLPSHRPRHRCGFR